MSTYVRYKQVMYPINKNDAKRVGYDNLDDFLSEYWNYEEHDNFEVQYAITEINDKWVSNYYLCYVLKYEYGYPSTSYGRNRYLSVPERIKYAKLFRTKLKDVEPLKFKLVDFCYYNGGEIPDYYLTEDEFNKEV